MIALIKVRSLNFDRLAEGFSNDVELSPDLRRIQRFFASFYLPPDLITYGKNHYAFFVIYLGV